MYCIQKWVVTSYIYLSTFFEKLIGQLLALPSHSTKVMGTFCVKFAVVVVFVLFFFLYGTLSQVLFTSTCVIVFF